ncbi:MAG: sugar ABC transporter permease [Gordonia sp. (in: high G+C Gram-positive bacteria)]
MTQPSLTTQPPGQPGRDDGHSVTTRTKWRGLRRPGSPATGARWTLVGFVAPGFILFAVFVIYPLISAVRYSLYNWSGSGPLIDFVGLRNYAYALWDGEFAPSFWRAIGHNLYFFAISMVLTLVVGLGLSYLLLLVGERSAQRYSVIFMLPFTLPPVVVAYVWTIYLEPNTGVLYNILATLHLTALKAPLLGSTSLALPTIAVITAWVGLGFPMLVFLAAFTEVPTELIDAASIDGAGRLRILWSVLIPAIRPTILTITSINFIGAFSTFDIIYIMEGSQAGPNYSTDVLGTLFYRTAFGGFGSTSQSMGLATALALLGFLVVTLASGLFVWLHKKATE